MGNCYSADQTAEEHIHTDITCNTEEHNRSTALERLVIDYLGVTGSEPSPLASAVVRNI